jgi:DnaJ-domain-containing protein 1
MKDYYRVIGVERDASEAEIKRSFRKLAVLYHPDKNPTHEAETLFKEINEAYEILSDPDKKFRYDQLLHSPSVQPGQQTYTRSQSRSSHLSERVMFMQSMLRYSQVLFYFGCLWGSVLVIDFVGPERVLEERVVTDPYDLRALLTKQHNDLLVTDKDHHFPLLMHELKYFPKGVNLKIYASYLFSALIKVENYNSTYEVNNLATVYRNFCFAPIMLLVCCAVGLIWRRGLEFHVNLGIVVFLLMILNIVFLFKSVI